MSVLIRYNPAGLRREQYDKVNEHFAQSDMTEPPPELQVHVLFGDDGELQVSEVWASEEAWMSYYRGPLGEALDATGIERNPQVIPVQELWGMGVPNPPAPPA